MKGFCFFVFNELDPPNRNINHLHYRANIHTQKKSGYTESCNIEGERGRISWFGCMGHFPKVVYFLLSCEVNYNQSSDMDIFYDQVIYWADQSVYVDHEEIDE